MTEFANKSKVIVIRTENGVARSIKINFSDFLNGKDLKKNNLELMVGDFVNVPE